MSNLVGRGANCKKAIISPETPEGEVRRTYLFASVPLFVKTLVCLSTSTKVEKISNLTFSSLSRKRAIRTGATYLDISNPRTWGKRREMHGKREVRDDEKE